MRGPRHQIPVHSPLTAAAWLAGVRAAMSLNGARARATASVEALLRERYAPRAVLLTESGTAALTAALIGVLRDRTRGPVAIPAYSCYDVATATEGAGAPVLLYDIDPHTLGPDLAQVQAALAQGAKAVVVAHLYGYPADVEAVNRLAAEAGAVVIEDAAQAAGAMVNNRPLGTRGSLGVLSFGRGKGLTGGSGGALLAFDDYGTRVLEQVRGLFGEPRRGWTELGTVAAQLLFERPTLYALPAALPFLHLGQTIYREPLPLRPLSTVSGAVIAATWSLAEREAETRRRNAERLLVEARRQSGLVTIDVTASARPGYLRLPVVASPSVRGAAASASARRLGVMSGYPKALCDVERVRRRCLNEDGAFSGSRELAVGLCTLPTHGRLAPADLLRLEQWIRTVGRRG